MDFEATTTTCTCIKKLEYLNGCIWIQHGIISLPYMLGKSPHASFRFNNLETYMQIIELE